MSRLIRYGAYPLIFGGAVVAVLMLADAGVSPWPAFALITVIGIAAVAVLERVQPYEREWLHDHDDTATDVIHLLVNLGLLSGTAYALHALRDVLPIDTVWPHAWPIPAQVLLAGAVIDFGLYAMHRLSHRVGWMWRLHATHHSAERLYWMNAERRHPLSALVLAGPGIVVVTTLGAPPLLLSAWFTLLSVHLAFQHANLDYSLGPFRTWLGVAENHRWHHKREYEDAQVNFGEFFLVWDHLCGTFHRPDARLGASEPGLREGGFPTRYFPQLVWPFRQR